MNKRKHTSAQVVAAIRGTGGIKQAIADRLGVHRHTVDYYLECYPAAEQEFINECEKEGDYAETVIISKMHETEQSKNKSRDGKKILIPTDKAVDIARWYAAKKLRKRGYGDALDITSDGERLGEWREERHDAILGKLARIAADGDTEEIPKKPD